jgi:PPOX class probable F420-dependent enzyme
MMQLDTSSEFGQRVQQRLKDEYVIWLTTTSSDGTPQPRPVWFIWEHESLLIYSEPGAQKVKHIGRNPKVAVHFNSDPQGENVVVFIGEAQIVENAPPPDKAPVYFDKYREGIAGLGMSPAEFGQTFSMALRVTPSRVRGF